MAELKHSGKKPTRQKGTVLVAYRYRIYPNEEQRKFFAKTFGCVRFYWNKALELKLRNLEAPIVRPAQLKKEYEFLKEVDSMALCNAQLQLERALSMWLQEKAGKPRFKRKKSRQSYTTNNINGSVKVDFERQTVKLPKLKTAIRAKLHRRFTGRIKSVTVEKTATGKHYISVLVEESSIPSLPEPTSRVCGIDLGLKDYVVIANDCGTLKIPHPRWIKKTEKQIAKLQKRLARKRGYRKGELKSGKFEKLRIRLAKLYEKLANQRKDFLHKLSKAIISENQAVAVESLCVRNMQKNGCLARAIADSSWAEFLRILEYKARWYGRKLVKASPNFPSSRLCSVCGWKNIELRLSDRRWKCPVCGTEHDRDVNAAKNLYLYGLARLKGGRVGPARTYARGEGSGGGTDIHPVYEPSLAEAGSSAL